MDEMPTDPTPPLNANAIPVMPVTEVGAPVPIPPHYLSAMMAAESEIALAQSAIDTEIAAMLDQAERELRAARTDVDIALATKQGDIHAELSGAMGKVYGTITRAMDAVIKDVSIAEYNLREAGIPFPYDWRAVVLVNEDTTGQMVLEILQGTEIRLEPVYDPTSVAVDTITAPTSGAVVVPVGSAGAPAPTVAPVGTSDSCECDTPAVPPVVPTVSAGGGAAGGGGAPGPALPVAPMPAEIGYAPVEPVAPVVPGGPVAPGVPLTLPGVPVAPAPIPPALPFPAPGDTSPTPAPSDLSLPPGAGVQWWRMDVCQQMHDAIPKAPAAEIGVGSVEEITGLPGVSLGAIGIGLDAILGTVDAAAGVLVDIVRKPVREAAANKLGETLAGSALVKPLLQALHPMSVTDASVITPLLTRLGLASWSETLTGVPLTYLVQTEQYLLQGAIPLIIPDQPTLNAAYLVGQITYGQWECLTRAHGHIPECWNWGLEASQTRPGPRELVDLYQRGVIETESAWIERMRQQGILDPKYSDEYLALAKWVPQPPDMTRLMTRDALDPAAVARAGLDTDFEQKFYGGPVADPNAPMVKWARASGIDAEMFRYLWRAHWELPSPTQLYEMLHRLRTDRPEYIQWAQKHAEWILGGKVGEEPVEPPTITARDVEETLKQDDKAPAFIKRLMAISYHPMNRTDALNAFHANLMSAEELHERFKDNGYDEPTAKRMVEIASNLRQRRLANVSGVWTVRKVMQGYRDGVIVRARADELLLPLVVDPLQRAALLRGVDLEASAETRKRQIAAIRRGYFVAAYGDDEAAKKLRVLGVDPQRESDLIAQWKADRDGRYREPSARQILQWATLLIITPDDAFTRLLRLGYERPDAERMVYQGVIAAQERIEGKIEKAQGKIEKWVKDQKQAKKEMTAELEARKKEIEKQQKEWEKEKERIQKELDARKK